MARKKARDKLGVVLAASRPEGAPIVLVRCPRCPARLAELWATHGDGGRGWDGITYADVKHQRLVWPPSTTFTCKRCKTTREVADAYLGGLCAGHKSEVILGEPLPSADTGKPGLGKPSRQW
ncbi:MAG: hypothetical protein AMXMBFR46_20710 [Acidimicrobiia bacterium]